MAALKLIRTGQISLEVSDYSQAVENASVLVQGLGGYVADTKTSRGTRDRRFGSLTARVPAAQFSAAFSGLRALGKVESESTGTEDVTKAYTDLETRLRVKREAAERMREILRGRAARLSDVLEVERELARVTEEIEQMEGERRFYDQRIALSTISVSLAEPEAVMSASALTPLTEALKGSLQFLATSLAALITFVVVLAPWALLAWLVWRIVRWRFARRSAARSAKAANEG